jgi:hypothetical protein
MATSGKGKKWSTSEQSGGMGYSSEERDVRTFGTKVAFACPKSSIAYFSSIYKLFFMLDRFFL